MGALRVGYLGSKATSGLCQPIIAMMPPHDCYIETHLGGGAIMKRKAPALRNIGIDLDAQAFAQFECGLCGRARSWLRAPVCGRVRLGGCAAEHF